MDRQTPQGPCVMGQPCTTAADVLASLDARIAACWAMAAVFLEQRDAHGLHDIGVEIEGLKRAAAEVGALVAAQSAADMAKKAAISSVGGPWGPGGYPTASQPQVRQASEKSARAYGQPIDFPPLYAEVLDEMQARGELRKHGLTTDMN